MTVWLPMALTLFTTHARPGLVAVFLLGLLFSVQPAVADAPVYPTVLIDNFIITNVKELASGGKTRTSKSFVVDPKDGPVWVMTNYLAEEGEERGIGMTTFDIMPRNVQVPAGTNIALFPSREMARFKPEEGLKLTVSGKTFTLSDNVLRELMTPEQFSAYQKAKESMDGILQLVKVQRFNIPADTETEIGIDMLRLENMTPHSLEVIIGQGSIPPELEAYMEKQNGSWLYRNRHMLAMIASFMLLGGWLWRKALG